MDASSAPRRYSWGPIQVLIGIGAAMGALLITNIFLVIVVVVTGRDFVLEDIGGVFEQANAVAEYAAARLTAAANGEALPDPPAILADLFLVKVGVAVTIALSARRGQTSFRSAFAPASR